MKQPKKENFKEDFKKLRKYDNFLYKKLNCVKTIVTKLIMEVHQKI